MDLNLLFSQKIIPVLVLDDPHKATDIGYALLDSGLPIVEVTLRTNSAWKSVEEFMGIKGLTVGVGSITKVDQIREAANLEVSFAVSPGMRPELVEVAQTAGLSYLPGVSNPSEMMQGVSAGLTHLKFFPAETLGGVRALRAMSAPFPNLSFVPTGGISEENISTYLSEKNVSAVGGSWMVSNQRISSGDFEGLRRDISNAVELARESRTSIEN